MHILDSEAKGLFEALQQLSDSDRQGLIAKVCQFTGRRIRDLEPEIQEILDNLLATRPPERHVVEKLRRLALAADESYFRLDESGEVVQSLKYFGKARLLTATVQGMESSTPESTADVIYELCKAYDDSKELFDFIESEMRGL